MENISSFYLSATSRTLFGFWSFGKKEQKGEKLRDEEEEILDLESVD